jgi:hypothetical protein
LHEKIQKKAAAATLGKLLVSLLTILPIFFMMLTSIVARGKIA